MLQLTKSQKEIQKAATEFAKGKFENFNVFEFDKKQIFPKEILKEAGELGFIGMHFPDQYLGQDLGTLENVLVYEAFCKKDSTIGCAISLAANGSECILRFGNDQQKEAFLPKIAEGKCLPSIALNQTIIGFDKTGTETTAKKDDDQWLINGDKHFILHGSNADFICVLCRTGDFDSPHHSSMIVVEKNSPGLSFGTNMVKMGLRTIQVSNLHFNNVKVPEFNLVGKIGKGEKVVFSFVNESQITFAAIALGIAQGAMDRALKHVKQREQFGNKIARFQAIQHKIADMATKIEQARFLTYIAADHFDKGKTDPKLCSMAKLASCRTAVEVSNEAIQLLGGYGYTSEYEVERYYRDAKAIELIGGGVHYLKDTIAKQVIGKIKK